MGRAAGMAAGVWSVLQWPLCQAGTACWVGFAAVVHGAGQASPSRQQKPCGLLQHLSQGGLTPSEHATSTPTGCVCATPAVIVTCWEGAQPAVCYELGQDSSGLAAATCWVQQGVRSTWCQTCRCSRSRAACDGRKAATPGP